MSTVDDVLVFHSVVTFSEPPMTTEFGGNFTASTATPSSRTFENVKSTYASSGHCRPLLTVNATFAMTAPYDAV